MLQFCDNSIFSGQHRLHLEQLVAVLGGLEEVEVFGGLLHEAAGALDAAAELVGRHVESDGVGGHEAGRFGFDVGTGSRRTVGRGVARGGGSGGRERVEVEGLADLAGRDAVLLVVADLLLAAAAGLLDGEAHALGDVVGIHDDEAVDVAGGTSGGLRERAVGAEEAFLVGVEDGHEGHFGQVEALAQEVDAHQDVVDAFAQVGHDLDTLQGVDVAVDVVAADPVVEEELGELLGHALGEGGDEGALAALDAQLDFLHEVVDLVVGGAHLDGRVEQAGGADDLVDDNAFGAHQLVVGGRGADVNGLRRQGFELVEGERTVVAGGRQAEAVLDEVLLAGAVAAIHGPDLRDGDVALVDHQEEVLGEEVEQAVGTRPGGTAVEVAGVVLDAGAVAQLADHLEVVGDALVQALGFEEAAFALEELDLAVEVVLNLVDGAEGVLLGGHEEVGGVDAVVVEAAEGDTRDGVHLLDAVHLVAPEGDAQEVVVVGQEDVHRVALDAEVAAVQFQVVAHVEAVHQAAEEDVAAESLAAGDVDGVVVEVGRIAHAVDAGHGGDHHHILASAEQGRGGRQAELVDFTVDGQVLLDVGIRRRDVGLGLVVVVVGHVVLHGVLREEALELAVELGGQRLVVAQDERGLVDVGDDVGDGEGLSRAGDTEQRLGRQALADTVGELADSFGLVARRLVVGGELELVHGGSV